MKNELLTLIKDDIKNTHLINGLQTLGVDADYYTSNCSDVVFSLMKLDPTKDLETIHKKYHDLKKWSFQKNTETDLDSVATTLYNFLSEHSIKGNSNLQE